MVNAVCSLKALDHYVIGDDEVIEEVAFGKRFKAQNPNLFIDLCPMRSLQVLYKFLYIVLLLEPD